MVWPTDLIFCVLYAVIIPIVLEKSIPFTCICSPFEKDPDVYPGIVLNYGKPEVDKTAKIDTEKTHDLFNSSIFSCTVRNALNRCLLKYGTRYPSLKLTNTSSAYQYFNIQKFDEGQGYHGMHCEHGAFSASGTGRDRGDT